MGRGESELETMRAALPILLALFVAAAAGASFLTGQLPIRMTDYGIKPPTAMMGTIKTGDDVKVTFRWVVEKAGERAQ